MYARYRLIGFESYGELIDVSNHAMISPRVGSPKNDDAAIIQSMKLQGRPRVTALPIRAEGRGHGAWRRSSRNSGPEALSEESSTFDRSAVEQR